MTRFARAKGSKASNERREEEATPWHVMRKQLAEKLSSDNVQNTDFSYNLGEILNKESKSQQTEIWSDFGEAKSKTKAHSDTLTGTKKKKKKEKSVHIIPNEELLKNCCEERSIKLKKKVKLNCLKQKTGDCDLIGSETQEDQKLANKGKNVIIKKIRKSTNLPKISEDKDNINKNSDLNFGIGEDSKHKSSKRKFEKNTTSFDKSTAKKPKLKGINTHKDVNTRHKEEENHKDVNTRHKEKENNLLKDSKSFNRLKKPSFTSSDLNTSKDDISSYVRQDEKNVENTNNRSKNNNYKFKSDFQFNKRPESSYSIIANGRKIDIVRFEGFLVKKDDASELKKLRKRLLAEKLPKDQINKIMKLERRKAEKSLTREKKKVCYHCRKFGHNMSDCPDSNDTELAKSGICFKCGSLEHTYFQCKVLQNQEFRHAVCFVCREQGHIARQCPLNSQGQYPKGGSCHLCGENTHLRKDCPKAVEEKASKSITVETLNSGLVEDINDTRTSRKENKLKQKKIVKFT